MVMTRRYFMHTFVISSIGLVLLGFSQKSVGYQEINSPRDEAGLREQSKSEVTMHGNVVNSRFKALPMLYDF